MFHLCFFLNCSNMEHSLRKIYHDMSTKFFIESTKNMETKINITSIIWYSQAPHLLDFELLSWELGVWTLLMASKVTISHGPFAAWWSNALPLWAGAPASDLALLMPLKARPSKSLGLSMTKFWVFRPVTFTSQRGWWPLFSTTSLLVFCLLPSLSSVPPKFMQCAQVLPITLLLLSYQNPGSLLTSTHLSFFLVGRTNFPSIYIQFHCSVQGFKTAVHHFPVNTHDLLYSKWPHCQALPFSMLLWFSSLPHLFTFVSCQLVCSFSVASLLSPLSSSCI